jgi:cell division protease FtsH
VNQFYKNLALWLVISLVMIMLFNMMTQQGRELKPVPYTTFLAALEEGEVVDVTIQGSNLKGTYSDGSAFKTYAPDDPDLISTLRAQGVAIEAEPDETNSFWMSLMVSWGPILLLIAVWIFFMRQMQSGGGKAMSFGKSRAKLLSESQAKITFSDVAGIDEAKDELEEVVSFLKDPKKFSRLGGRIPKGVLLVGPPGTGKTLLGRAIAGEAGVPFFSISGSDFVEMFVGVGASRVRDLFVQGKKNAPCIIFIDEIDAVGRHRGAGMGGGHDEREQTLNQLLVEMDGFESNEGVILIAATNRPDVLDPALLRPGRFDRQVVVPRPDVRGRSKILQVHARKVPLGKDVDLEVIAKGTPGFSGADLENLVNEAALLAARANKNEVTREDLEKAKDKVMMGAERRSMVITEEEKKVTAYHEAGHALVAMYIPGADPVHKVSIIPRGRAMGVTMYLPEEEKYNETRLGLNVKICTLLGGRVAEELIFESVTSGASNDLERATAIARKMVCEWGMSDKLGPLAFGEKEGEVFLGRDYGHVKNYSEATAIAIDEEIRAIVEENYVRTRDVLSQHKDALIDVSEALLERENMDGSEIRAMIFPEEAASSAEATVDSSDSEVATPAEAADNSTDSEAAPTEAAVDSTDNEVAKESPATEE